MMTSEEGVFKINKVIHIERLSQQLFMSKFQYQNSTKL